MPISVLFPTTHPPGFGEPSEATADLNLDQVIAAITAPCAEYELGPVFYRPLTSADDVGFRQAVFRDVRRAEVRSVIDDFAEGMRAVRGLLKGIDHLYSRRQQQAWFLDAAERYCQTIDALAAGFEAAHIDSVGLRSMQDHVVATARSDRYTALQVDATRVLTSLHEIRYSLTVVDSRIIVRPYEGDADYSDQVLRTFERFRQRDVIESATARLASTYMNGVDARVLDVVAELFPVEFAALDEFCERHRPFIDDTLSSFDREIQFYVATLDFMARLSAAGLPVGFPTVSDDDTSIEAYDIYDIALADKLVDEQAEVVLNDLILGDEERIAVVTGPNQGGKTTFARVFGQLHHLAALGCPTPGRHVRLGLFDRIFTHFERTEDLRTLTGKLEDELVRIRRVLDNATDRSIVVMNESFGSTSLRDARLIGTATIERLIELGLRAVYVTFVDELSRLDPAVVSMVSTVAADDPSRRTFKVVRQRADGLAYAICLAERHGLTARQLRERIGA